MSDNELMSDLEAAFDLHNEEEEVVEATDTEDEQIELFQDENQEEPAVEEPGEAPEAELSENEPSDEAVEPADPKTEKAPASWSPKAREAWDKLPPEAKAQIAKREAEINNGLQIASTARKVADQLNRTIAPFKDSLMQAGYTDPMQAIGSVLAAEKTLRTGNQQQKALQVANMIQQFGVDIATLDGVLSGRPQQPGSNVSLDIESLLAERLAPVEQMLARQAEEKQIQEYRTQQEAVGAVEAFGSQSDKAPYFNDVRGDMADLLDLAAQRGQVMTLEQAYHKACAIHPEISEIMDRQRQEQTTMANANKLAGKQKAAGASLTGRPVGNGGLDANKDMRGLISELWDSA